MSFLDKLTEEQQIEAVKEFPYLFKEIENPSKKVILEYIKKCPDAIVNIECDQEIEIQALISKLEIEARDFTKFYISQKYERAAYDIIDLITNEDDLASYLWTHKTKSIKEKKNDGKDNRQFVK